MNKRFENAVLHCKTYASADCWRKSTPHISEIMAIEVRRRSSRFTIRHTAEWPECEAEIYGVLQTDTRDKMSLET